MRIKIDKADALFSLIVRNRDKWTCQRCGKKYPEGARGLHNSHFFGRGRENTRFSEINCDALCMGCHSYFTANPAEFVEWKKKRIGEAEYNKLMLKANTYCKKDRKMVVLYLTQKLKALKKGKK